MTNDFKWKVHKDPARLGQELWQIVNKYHLENDAFTGKGNIND